MPRPPRLLRPLARALRRALTALSALLLLATLAAWIWSCWQGATFVLRRDSPDEGQWGPRPRTFSAVGVYRREWRVEIGGGDVGYAYDEHARHDPRVKAWPASPTIRWEYRREGRWTQACGGFGAAVGWRVMARPIRILRFAGRALRRLLTGLSALLLLATFAAWGRGCWSGDRLVLARESLDEGGWRLREWTVQWGGGDVGVIRWSTSADAARAREAGCPPGERGERNFVSGPPERVARAYAEAADGWRQRGRRTTLWDLAVFVAAREEDHGPAPGLWGGWVLGADIRLYRLALPCWMPAILFSVLPAWRGWGFVRRRRLRRRARAGLCAGCGYDLRATPEGGGALVARCPECGRERQG